MTTRNGMSQFFTSLSAFINSDAEDHFPLKFFTFLRDHDVLKFNLPAKNIRTILILNLLREVGRKHLSGGRILEGHFNVVQLIKAFASSVQLSRWSEDLAEQKLFGVWNTQGTDGVEITDQGNGTFRLTGCKTFCSGADFIDRPLITAQWTDSPRKGWQMIILSGEKARLVKSDPEFWHPLGMKGSVSYRMNFTGILISGEDLLGQPGDYYRQPLFSGGAIRFAAVQLGGAEAILTEAQRVLKLSNRTGHPFQQSRIAEMTFLVETGRLWLTKAGSLADDSFVNDSGSAKLVAYANMTRTVIERICLKVMQLAEKSIGSQAFMQVSPLEQLHRDLTTYLRQPGPDAVLTSIGAYAFDQTDMINLWNLKDE
ncbi:acyl-CoA dehydrogenase [Mucilaginibacter corticis]|uniref:Acyl-CoA dehydrogenase n=1 Tax=Mucilaginibacter corticis TaxID=2597670 RepID=A0A556M8U9_9SPHI|nr:acyl-CoA dehydrogenase family protein [Mucilaginibacter corticis]TSJ36322.1 acyl-CoA dehydrogenase [Mucilaginibacter corticis]